MVEEGKGRKGLDGAEVAVPGGGLLPEPGDRQTGERGRQCWGSRAVTGFVLLGAPVARSR